MMGFIYGFFEAYQIKTSFNYAINHTKLTEWASWWLGEFFTGNICERLIKDKNLVHKTTSPIDYAMITFSLLVFTFLVIITLFICGFIKNKWLMSKVSLYKRYVIWLETNHEYTRILNKARRDENARFINECTQLYDKEQTEKAFLWTEIKTKIEKKYK